MTTSGWIGVDLDSTLAYYDGWKGEDHIGEPVPAMVLRVKTWIALGANVKIFTARVSGLTGAYDLESKRVENKEFAEQQTRLIQEWTEKHIGQRLEVTCVKDFAMIELWDDRCVQVVPNTGQTIVDAARRLIDNIYEFGNVTDGEIIEEVDKVIKRLTGYSNHA